MANGEKRREIPFEDAFSSDTILVMLVGELLSWLRAAEKAEAALAALAQQPGDAGVRDAYDEAIKAVTQIPTGWIDMHAPEKVPDADLPTQMREIRKLLRQIDFLLMPDTTVPEEQALSGVKARLRGQADRIGIALDSFADVLRGMIGS